jgi:hypothetical protein
VTQDKELIKKHWSRLYVCCFRSGGRMLMTK